MRKSVLFWVFIVSCFISNLFAKNLYVDVNNGFDRQNDSEEFPCQTINYAIFLAYDGDTILVKPGTYNESIDFKGKQLTIKGYEGVPILNGGGAVYVSAMDTQGPLLCGVTFQNGETNESKLCNFIIKGYYTGIYCGNASPTIQNVTVADNQNGISNVGTGEPVINNCIVWGNGQGIFNCSAEYSCLQNEMPGNGNILEDPLFADENYHLSSRVGRNPEIGCSEEIVYEEPTYVYELSFNLRDVSTPFLTDNRLTIFFTARDESGSKLKIYKATRTDTNSEFGNFIKLDHINRVAELTNVSHPWVSSDMRRIYYHTSDEIGIIRMAEWSDAQNDWLPKKTFNEITDALGTAAGASLSTDELTIYFHSKDSSGNIDIWTASRTSINDPFENIHRVNELNLIHHQEYSPFITRDEQYIYFVSTRNSSTTKIFCAKKDENGLFSDTIELPFNDNFSYNAQPFVTFDKQYLYFTGEDDWGDEGIWCSKITKRFENVWTKDNVTSPCIDAGDETLSPLAEAYPNGGRINMGAYGGTPLASCSENDWPNKADINRDGIVNMLDVAEFADNWLWKAQWID